MIRNKISEKRLLDPDLIYKSRLVNLLISRILKVGKKNLAKKIVYKAFQIIKSKTKQNPLTIFEKAVINASPTVEIKSIRVRGSSRSIPIEVKPLRAILLALKWLIIYSRKRRGRGIVLKLANEIIDAKNKTGRTIKKKNDTHKIALSNRAFLQYKYKTKKGRNLPKKDSKSSRPIKRVEGKKFSKKDRKF
uniref:Small ribosomal subunit protein uS7c n=1 Tax=Astrosyne radiata TaxID=1158023 RepID=A0A2U9NTL9_9STRA|nr:ribosomal protein S7 [Astrosyne radiata]AWT40375.1 ribosomal protein S7 [Astrosyne radiata]